MTFLVTGPNITTDARVATHSSSSAATYTTTSTVMSAFSYRSTEGRSTPNYWQLKRSGKLVPYQPFAQFEFEASYTGYRTERTTTIATGAWVQTTTVGTPKQVDYTLHEAVRNDMVAPYAYEVQQELVQQCAAQIASSGWDGLTFVSEIHKTRDMFLNLLHKLIALKATFIRSFSKGIKQRDMQRFYAAWLEGRYGWRTLLYDLEDLQKLARNLNKAKPLRQSRICTRTLYPDAVVVEADAPSGALTSHSTRSTTDQVSLNGHLAADIAIGDLQLNPFVTAWELVPYSFVVDWFVNVGQAIQASTFLASAESYTSSGGLRIDRSFVATTTGSPNNVDPLYLITGSQNFGSSYSATLSVRQPVSFNNIPVVRVRLDAFKVVDLMALLLQTLRI